MRVEDDVADGMFVDVTSERYKDLDSAYLAWTPRTPEASHRKQADSPEAYDKMGASRHESQRGHNKRESKGDMR